MLTKFMKKATTALCNYFLPLKLFPMLYKVAVGKLAPHITTEVDF